MQEAAEKEMSPVNPTLLGLYLNYSVFYYEIKENTKYACELARRAFDTAVQVLDTLPENDYKDTTLILQLLRDNLTLWSTEVEK